MFATLKNLQEATRSDVHVHIPDVEPQSPLSAAELESLPMDLISAGSSIASEGSTPYHVHGFVLICCVVVRTAQFPALVRQQLRDLTVRLRTAVRRLKDECGELFIWKGAFANF